MHEQVDREAEVDQQKCDGGRTIVRRGGGLWVRRYYYSSGCAYEEEYEGTKNNRNQQGNVVQEACQLESAFEASFSPGLCFADGVELVLGSEFENFPKPVAQVDV